MAKILTTQAELDDIFKRMESEYLKLNERQQAYAVREINKTRGEVAELLAEYADADNTIKQRRMTRIMRDLDEIEKSLRETGEIAIENIIDESSEWTTDRVSKAIGISLSASQFDRINKHVTRYVIKRFGEDGLVLSERVWGLSGEVRDELSMVIRRGILKGDGINAMIPQIRKTYDNESWKIRRLARNESVTAHRAAIGYNAQESGIVKWVQFHHGAKRSRECVELADYDKYNKGNGIYKPTDTEIWMPHVNCTGYATYVLDDI